MLLVLFASFCFGHIAAQTYTVHVTNTGQLQAEIELQATLADVVNLTIITDAEYLQGEDFWFMRDNLPNLKTLDISGVTLRDKKIPDRAFAQEVAGIWVGHAALQSVTFPTTTTFEMIGEHAFHNCPSLGAVDLSGCTSLETIVNGAFEGSGMTSIQLPNSLKDVRQGAFSGTQITELNLLNTSIETLNSIIGGNESPVTYAPINTLLLPAGLKTINGYSLTFFNNIEELTIPASVTSINGDAFQSGGKSTNVKTITVEDGNANYFTQDNALYEKDASGNPTGRMMYYAHKSEVEHLVIPEGITIVDGCFKNAINIERIDFPTTLTDLWGETLQNCTALGILAFKSTTLPYFDDMGTLLHGANKGAMAIYVPAGKIDAYFGAINCADINKANYKEAYTVTITGGTASSTFDIPGTIIDITADAPDAGEEFKTWSATGVTLGSNTSATTTFTMPTNDVSITATFGTNTGINDIQGADDIIIYPNPTADFIQVKGLSESVSFNIINSLGQTVKSGLYNGSIGVNDLPAGIYFFSIAGKTKTFIKK